MHRSIAIAALVFLGTVAAAALILVIADRVGFSATSCSAVAFDAGQAEGAVDLPPSLLEAHPEILAAIERVDPPQGGVADVDCAKLDQMRADVDATGAPRAGHDHLVRHEGRSYELSLTRAVA